MDNLLQKLMLGGSTAALMTAMSLTGAQAQDDIEQVVVSASRISIAGYSQPTPVTVVGAAQLEKAAFANISDSVRALPMVTSPPSSNSINNGGAISGTEGLNTINLRAIGSNRTLVLFDGQRVVQSALSGGVDTSTIPGVVVSRVDVVTAGASATWGSDAVAGVVNYVLNKNFDGWKANLMVGDNSQGSYRTLNMSGAYGSDVLGGRGHIILGAEFEYRPDLVLQGNLKWFSDSFIVSNPSYVAGTGKYRYTVANNVGFATFTIGGLIVSSPAGTGASPAAANALRGIEFIQNGIPQRVDFGNVTLGTISNGGSLDKNDTQVPNSFSGVPHRRYTFFGYAKYKLTDTINASLQLNYGNTSAKNFGQANYQLALTIKSDNAYIPASVRAAMTAGGISSFTMGIMEQAGAPPNVKNEDFFSNAYKALGPSITTNQHQLMRGVFTLDGTIGDNWSWNAFYQHSTVRYVTHAWSNDLIARRALAQDAVTVTTANRGTSGLALGVIACRSTLTAPTNGCIPYSVFGEQGITSEALRWVAPPNEDYQNTQMNQDEVAGQVQGVLPWELPAGKVAVAFGAGYRMEAAVSFADPRGFNAEWSTGNWTSFPSVHYITYEAFGEIDAPILKDNIVQSLDISMAGRMTDYSTSGMVETWKLGATSQVIDDLKLRTTWSVDIRAPSLNDLYAVALQSSGTNIDPKTQALVATFTNTHGNPNLEPEVARTISAGVVLSPRWIDGLQLSVDYFSINLTKALGTISNTQITNTCSTNINDPLCARLTFAGPIGAKGPALSTVDQYTVNIATISTSGFDIQANYGFDFWNGQLNLMSTDTYQDQLTQSQPGTQTNDYAGVMGGGRAPLATGTPKWKGVVEASYEEGAVTATISGRWFGTGILNNQWNTGNLANQAGGDPEALDPKWMHVPLTAFMDLRGNYRWNDNISFYGAIDNALGNPPPVALMFTTSTIHPQGTYTSVYDQLGRTFRIGVRASY